MGDGVLRSGRSDIGADFPFLGIKREGDLASFGVRVSDCGGVLQRLATLGTDSKPTLPLSWNCTSQRDRKSSEFCSKPSAVMPNQAEAVRCLPRFPPPSSIRYPRIAAP